MKHKKMKQGQSAVISSNNILEIFKQAQKKLDKTLPMPRYIVMTKEELKRLRKYCRRSGVLCVPNKHLTKRSKPRIK